MIAADPRTCHTAAVPDWQRQLAEAVRDPLQLLELLGLAPEQLGPEVTAAGLAAAARDFPLRVPGAFIARMRHGDPRDPLLLQVLAHPRELEPAAGFVADPLEEAASRSAPGLLRKYAGRALLIATGACAVHCRYCFRRHYDYGGEQDAGPRWDAALAAVAGDATIEELILSGGDPLSLGNTRLAQLLAQLAGLPQLRRIRIHTRVPVVLPARVDEGLLALFAPLRERLVVVVHANHPAEIDTAAAAALRELARTCTALLNQSVLLAGVNDDAPVLAELSRRLFAAATLPYYLHQLDRVAGAAHFAVTDAAALALHRQLHAALPGYLVPRLVREVAGAPGKLSLTA
ncbi:MAG TPA: EF-P beta-lysylation protein EpmB [Steroidobacteraceae bacterium]|nr:EF-P beta-lysylation protein EpmB [Steroidobacteraceae bacterium]